MTSQPPLASPEPFITHGPIDARHPDLRVISGSSTERKFVTVLFADVKGSMGLSKAIALEDWWSVIAGLFELMCESVYRFGGWVGNFTGDGIVALFEPLGRAGEHACRACEAALWLRDAMRVPAEEVRCEHGLELSIRLGLNSGEVLTGTIGGRYSRYYTAAGYAVALARRMEALASPGRIYLTEHTAALVGAAVALRELGAFEVKGAQFPLGVFELLETGCRP
jgi:class 3 adenylate cyclase